MKSRWWIVVASVLGLLVGNGPVMQFTFGTLLPSITKEFGWSRGLVSSAMVVGLWVIGGRLVSGFLVDRFHAPRIAVSFFLAPLLGIIVLLTTLRAQEAALGAVLLGLGLGAEVDLIAFLQSRYLGMRAFGEIYGYFFSIFMLGAGLGPFALGVSYDSTGSYRFMLICFVCALALASLPMLRLGSYPYPMARENARAAVQ